MNKLKLIYFPSHVQYPFWRYTQGSLDFLILLKCSKKTSDWLISEKWKSTKNTVLETIHGVLQKYLATLICLYISFPTVLERIVISIPMSMGWHQHLYYQVQKWNTSMISNNFIFTLEQSNISNKHYLIIQNSIQVSGFSFCLFSFFQRVVELMGFCFHSHIHFLCKEVLFKQLSFCLSVTQLLEHPFRSNSTPQWK